LVLSGPCGTGKTSLTRAWREREPALGYTRSVTTRRPRAPTEDHYDYVSRAEFLELIAAGEFVQWIRPSYDEYYCTRRAAIDAAIAEGRDLVFDYCPEGYLNLRAAYPAHVVGIFIMAPDLETMKRRLEGRGSESAAELELRYRMALADFNFVDEHRYHVINDDFERALTTLQAIRCAERARLDHQRAALPRYAELASPALLRYYEPAT
jgi:guanylate kinase